MAGWDLMALSAQITSYRTFKAIKLFWKKLYFNEGKLNVKLFHTYCMFEG